MNTNMNVLVLGNGLLGSEVIRQTNWDFISRKRNGINFCNPITYYRYLVGYDIIFNAIGHTKTYSDERDIHLNTNFKAVINLVSYCNDKKKKIVQISTDYLYGNSKENTSENDQPANCANWYSYSKLLGDGYVQVMAKDYLLIRTSFRPVPFPYPEISIQQGNFDYVPKIARLIIELINKGASGIFNVGREKSWNTYEMAIETRPDTKIREKKIYDSLPENITMNVLKMKEFLENNK
jgi:dTDP-4-dehydrorhamnose reductase